MPTYEVTASLLIEADSEADAVAKVRRRKSALLEWEVLRVPAPIADPSRSWWKPGRGEHVEKKGKKR